MYVELPEQSAIKNKSGIGALEQYSILDTLPEQSYEDLTELASVICDTPISLVTLVAEDRQWFKSERGFGQRETPLALSFCARAVQSGETLIVEDAQRDERFETNALVTADPHIRFYAGAPIVDEAGQVLGTVCVLDTVPRNLTRKQISSLEALARQAMTLLDIRRTSTYMERSVGIAPELAEKLALATDVAQLGIYSWDERTDRAYWENDRMYAILGRSRDEEPINAAEFVARVVLPEHAEIFQTMLQRAVDHGESFRWRGQIRRGDGLLRWVELTGLMTDATPERRRRLIGTALDVTEQVQKEDELRTSLQHVRLAQDSARLVLWDWEVATGRLQWTGNTEWIYGSSSENFSELSRLFPRVHEEDRASLTQAIETAIASKGGLELGFRVWWPDGSLHSIIGQGHSILSHEGEVVRMLGVQLDITNSVTAHQQLGESEARAERILESIGDAVIVTDAETRVSRMNGVAESLTGWSLHEAKGQPLSLVFNIVNETTRELVESPADKVKRLGTVVGLANHTVLIASDGTERNIDDSGAPIRDESGNLVGIVLVFRDITEKYRLERAAAEESKRQEFLLKVSDRHRQLTDAREIMEVTAEMVARELNAGRVGYAEAYSDGKNFGLRIGWAQGGMQKLTGAASLETFGSELTSGLRAGRTMTFTDVSSELKSEEAAAYEQLGIRAAIIVPMLKNEALRGTLYVNDPNPRVWTPSEIHLVQEVAERSAEAVERAHVQAELRFSAERLRLATTAAKGMGVFDWHVKTDIFFGDEAFSKIFGLGKGDGLGGTTLPRVVAQMHPEDQPRVQAAIERTMRFGGDYAEEYRAHSEGGYRWVSARGCCLFDEHGEPERFPGVVWDITERKQVEDDLKTSEANLSLAVNTARLGIWSLNIVTDTLQCSAVCKENFGRRATQTFTYLDLLKAVHPDDLAKMQVAVLDAIQHGTEYRYEYRIFWPDGTLHWILASGRVLPQKHGQPLTMVGVTLNTTERKLAEGALVQNEKLAAVGRLASSIAHEINNPLESVTNLLYLAKGTQDLEELREYLESADAELRRASAITSHTLRFHKQATDPVAVVCDNLIASVLAVYDGRLKNAPVKVQKRKRAHRPVVCFDGEIRQVLGNLVGNAVDAMSPQGGRLLIRSREGHDWKTGRQGLVLTVADTGPGMPAKTAEKVFEAFFTTKGIGGTGLGLWISKEIVERHYGRLAVRSSQSPGKSGTVFTLFLPFEAISR